MMTSNPHPNEVFVWIWLAGATDPVVAGRLHKSDGRYIFNYGRSYLDLKNAIPIYEPELPLEAGAVYPIDDLIMASSLRDASPDAWGRRVIINLLTGLKGKAAANVDFDELTFLINSGSDRIGALDFQADSKKYEARDSKHATLTELQESAERVLNGEPLNPELHQALHIGSAIGGARPKVLIDDNDVKYIAKFQTSADAYDVVGAEFVAMRLAEKAGLDVAPVKIGDAAHKKVLLIERFDREKTEAGWTRRSMVSALTLFGLDEIMAAHASYEDLAGEIRRRFIDHSKALTEMFKRLCFNILVSNTDDHARNHAAFWDGRNLELTPAYDICPQRRTNHEVNQAMLIQGQIRQSKLINALDSVAAYQISRGEGLAIIKAQIVAIRDHWDEVCAEGKIKTIDKQSLWRTQFLHPFAFEGLEEELSDEIADL